jgi:transglutaminase-like putative cysteine protease
MNRNIICLLAFCAASATTYSQQPRYDALSIPAKLKEGAHVVKRFEDARFEVTDIDNAHLKVHQVFTVLDKEGDKSIRFHEQETKYRKLKDVEITGYNTLGIQTGRFKRKDLVKRASLDGLTNDITEYYFSPASTSYPATLEIEYEISYSGTLFYPSYEINEEDESVEQSSFTVKVPTELGLHFRAQKTDIKPTIKEEGSYTVYNWQVSDLKAVPKEEGSVRSDYYYSKVVLAPNKFRLYDTKGDLSTWKYFGAWSYELNKGLEELPEDRKAFYQELVKNASTDREKVEIVYKYLQQNFRYVSIQLGIGGYKPFPAKFTDEKKYGDCKGLSFYMLSVLNALNIKSYFALVNAYYDKEPVSADFPVQVFNHAILCVPQPKDSIWLDCTSNDAEFGVLGSFTENRNALLVTENGGVLVSTPRSRPSENLLAMVTDIALNEDGSGITQSTTCSKGEMRSIMKIIFDAKKDEQKDMLVNYLGFKQPDEFALTHENHPEDYNVNMKLSIEKIPQFSAGSKMFLNPRIYTLWPSKLPKAEGRTQDYYFRCPFIKTDTTRYHLPAEYSIEVLPRANAIECAYGSYKTDYVFNAQKRELVSIARLELKQNKIPAAQYASVKEFFDKVLTDGTQKLIIKKD